MRDASPRILHLETHSDPVARGATLRTITDGGYRRAERTALGGPAEAFVFVKP